MDMMDQSVNETNSAISIRDRINQAAQQLYAQNPDWLTFFREILSADGIVRRLHPSPDALAEFEQTEDHAQLQQMLAKLRSGARAGKDAKESAVKETKEPTRVITVRLPKSLHETLRAEAHDHHTSINQLCIAKLLQMVDEGLLVESPRGGGATAEENAFPERTNSPIGQQETAFDRPAETPEPQPVRHTPAII